METAKNKIICGLLLAAMVLCSMTGCDLLSSNKEDMEPTPREMSKDPEERSPSGRD